MTLLFLPFLSKPLLKIAFRSVKWGSLTLKWNLVLDVLILKWNFPHNFRGLEINLKWNKANFLLFNKDYPLY